MVKMEIKDRQVEKLVDNFLINRAVMIDIPDQRFFFINSSGEKEWRAFPEMVVNDFLDSQTEEVRKRFGWPQKMKPKKFEEFDDLIRRVMELEGFEDLISRVKDFEYQELEKIKASLKSEKEIQDQFLDVISDMTYIPSVLNSYFNNRASNQDELTQIRVAKRLDELMRVRDINMWRNCVHLLKETNTIWKEFIYEKNIESESEKDIEIQFIEFISEKRLVPFVRESIDKIGSDDEDEELYRRLSSHYLEKKRLEDIQMWKDFIVLLPKETYQNKVN